MHQNKDFLCNNGTYKYIKHLCTYLHKKEYRGTLSINNNNLFVYKIRFLLTLQQRIHIQI